MDVDVVLKYLPTVELKGESLISAVKFAIKLLSDN